MKPRYAHVSRTVLVLIAAAGAVWLSAFFLPGAGVQPVPLLPVIGGVAGKVVAVAEPRHKTASEVAQHRTVGASAIARAPFAPPASLLQTSQPRPTPRVVHKARRATPPHHAAKPKRSSPVQSATPASATATVRSASYVATARAPRGRAVGWHRKHEESTSTPATAPTHGPGTSHAKRDAPSAQPAAAPTPTPAVSATSPPAAGHDNGKHRGDDHDHGDQGNGPGGKK